MYQTQTLGDVTFFSSRKFLYLDKVKNKKPWLE